MKYFYTLLLAILLPYFASAQQNVTYSVNPPSFNETESVTATFTVNEGAFGVTSSHQLYLWAWSYDSNNVQADCPTNGTWTASNAANKFSVCIKFRFKRNLYLHHEHCEILFWKPGKSSF